MKNSAANISSDSSGQTRNESIQMDEHFSDELKPVQSSKKSLRNRAIQTIVDLVVIICIFIVFGLVYLLQPPKIQYFTCDMTDIFFPNKPDTVNITFLSIFDLFSKFTMFYNNLDSILGSGNFRDSWPHSFHHSD